MQIQDLKVKKARGIKRIGRGGKKGTYSGKGMKGQRSRSGFSQRATFEGGMSTLVARTKKLRGFKSSKQPNQVVSLAAIEVKFNDTEVVNPDSLKAKNLIGNKKRPVKILSGGKLSKKITFENVLASTSAKEAIEKAGGKLVSEK